MADPTTIIAYATNRRDNAKTVVTAAQQRLANAQSDISANGDDLAKNTSASADLEKKAADIRAKLSEVPTPADGTALLDALEQTIIRLRTRQAAILKARSGLFTAQAAADLAQSDLAAAVPELANAEAALKRATLASKQRNAWITALGAAPLSTIKADATDALDEAKAKGAAFKNAKKRITDEIPAKLRTRAQERRTAEAARIDNSIAATQAAEDAALAERDKNGGLGAQAGDLSVTFLRLEAAAADFVNTAKGRFDQTQAMLAQVSDPAFSPLTPEQTGRINDATLTAARGAAADAEKALNDLLKSWENAQILLDAAILAAIADNSPANQQAVKDKQKDVADAKALFSIADVAWRVEEKDREDKLEKVAAAEVAVAQAIQKAIAGKKDPEKDPNVTKARNDLGKAQTDLKKAEDAYKLSNHGILHAWEAAVPDTTWRLFEDYEQAVQMLTALKASDPAKLATDLPSAEGKYVAAQLAADASANVIAQLAAEQAQRSAQQENASQAGGARLFSALRGDN